MKSHGYWTYERCEELAKSCKSARELRKKESGAFAKAYAKGWLKDWFETRPNSKPIGYWTHERCEEEAKNIPPTLISMLTTTWCTGSV